MLWAPAASKISKTRHLILLFLRDPALQFIFCTEMGYGFLYGALPRLAARHFCRDTAGAYQVDALPLDSHGRSSIVSWRNFWTVCIWRSKWGSTRIISWFVDWWLGSAILPAFQPNMVFRVHKNLNLNNIHVQTRVQGRRLSLMPSLASPLGCGRH